MTTFRGDEDGRCVDCGQRRHKHGAGGECDATFAGVYGPENPTVQWLKEHAPRALEEPARTVAPSGLWDEEELDA